MSALQARQTASCSRPAAPSCPVLPRRVSRACAALRTAPAAAVKRSLCVARAASEQVEVKEVTSLGGSVQEDVWVPVCLPEELPKGVRKEVEVDGRQVLLFWYRNQICAIEGRSPAEGAYSEGFIAAKFTQDYCIECPATGSLFSIKDGSIQSWYPNNPVLRALTPKDTCRNMEVYPVKLTQQAICVDVSGSTKVATRSDRGGAGTSLENNNVFTVQPNVYFEGMDPSKEQASVYQDAPATPLNPAVAATAVLAFGAVAVAGTAIIIYIVGTS